MILETENLQLRALDKAELELYCSGNNALEKVWGMQLLTRELTERIKTAIQNKILPVFDKPGINPLFYTFWIIIDKKHKSLCGELCFKGEANANRELEIAYATYPSFREKGYMTEAIRLLCDWALNQEGIGAITAYTDPKNIASIKVLEKNGFQMAEQSEANLKFTLSFAHN